MLGSKDEVTVPLLGPVINDDDHATGAQLIQDVVHA
jgi:hypothetical protein